MAVILQFPTAKARKRAHRATRSALIVRAFTGPSKLTEVEVEQVANWCLDMPEADEVRSGCAAGVDTVAAEITASLFQQVKLHLFVPAAPHNNELVATLERAGDAEITRLPNVRATRGAAYRDRNRVMVAGSTELRAVLRKPTFYRSGEWMTVNIANNLRIPVYTLILES